MPIIKKARLLSSEDFEVEFGRSLMNQARMVTPAADRILSLYWNRMTTVQIGKEMGYSQGRISLWLSDFRKISPLLAPYKAVMTTNFLSQKDIDDCHLGSLCCRQHDYEGTGQSMRLNYGPHDCLICFRIRNRLYDYRRKNRLKKKKEGELDTLSEILKPELLEAG